ncbi:MAG: hypothetical protein IKZ16_09025, partial [Clostridia bacterium]|nr:hypothetical protein [Clostridia bacterium]
VYTGSISKVRDKGIGKICTSKQTWFGSRAATVLEIKTQTGKSRPALTERELIKSLLRRRRWHFATCSFFDRFDLQNDG